MNKLEAQAALQRLKEACNVNDIDFENLLFESAVLFKNKSPSTPKPHVFSSKDELQEALKISIPLLNAYLAHPFVTLEEAIKYSVGGNTFRAFHLKAETSENRPSKIYRRVVNGIFKTKLHEFMQFDNAIDYDKFVIDSSKEISKTFNLISGKPEMMGFGRAAKLFNLSCKAMFRYREITLVQKEKLIKLAHVPWDSFTIQGIRRLQPPFPIKANETMAWAPMNDVSKYKQLQQWIRDICSEVDRYPIHYEFVAWDKAH